MNSDKLSDKLIYDEPVTTCPLCGAGSIKKKYYINKFNPPFHTDVCMECGFIFMNPRFTKETIRNFYNKEYYSGKSEYVYYDERDAEKYSMHVWNRRIQKIRKYIDQGNFLDIGCAFGGLLKAASEYFTPYGIEMSEYSGEYAVNHYGENIHIGTLYTHPFGQNFFSVVTMVELIEHLDDPVFAISECHKLLREDGLLVIQTANMNGLQARLLKENYGYYLPGHLSYFTKKNLTDLLKQTGFRKIKVFHPVEFGLMPKLLKSRYTFKSAADYLRWIRITYYHLISKFAFGNFAATSSMVLYAFK